MRNKNTWSPSKFVVKNNRLRASRDPTEVTVASRLILDSVAQCYDTYIKQYCKGKLLDLGCGKVPLYNSYKQYVSQNMCVDWLNSTNKSDCIDVISDLNNDLPFKNNTFDTIILSDVLEHIAEPQRLWFEISRLLVANGILILNTPFYYWIHEFPHDYYRYTYYALARFAERAGFRIEVVKTIGGAPEIIVDILAKNMLKIRFLGRFIAQVFQCSLQFALHIGFIKKISLSTANLFPLGYFMIVRKRSA